VACFNPVYFTATYLLTSYSLKYYPLISISVILKDFQHQNFIRISCFYVPSEHVQPKAVFHFEPNNASCHGEKGHT
jgi:hypothetical protein